MAKRKGSSGSGADRYAITAANLLKKGKTNKKLKRNAMASKYETVESKRIKEAAVAMTKEHPAGTGYKFRNKKTI